MYAGWKRGDVMAPSELSTHLGKECLHFLEIAERGSFLAASQHLYVSQPALIKQINQLEKALGFPLFIRTHKGVVLTEAGEELQKGLKELYRFSDELLERCREAAFVGAQKKEVLHVGYLESDFSRSLFSVNIAAAYRKVWPHVEMSLTGLPLDRFTEYVQDGSVDVVSCFETSAIRNSDLLFLPISEHPCHCVLSVDHPLAGKERLQIHDLYHHKVLLPKAGLFYVTDCIRRELRKAGQKPEEGIYDKTTPLKTVIENKIMIGFGNVYEYSGAITIPLDFPVTARFGILSRQEPGKAARNFIQLALSPK